MKHTLKFAREALRPWFAALQPAEMNAQAEDAEIAKLCAPLPKLVATLDLGERRDPPTDEILFGKVAV